MPGSNTGGFYIKLWEIWILAHIFIKYLDFMDLWKRDYNKLFGQGIRHINLPYTPGPQFYNKMPYSYQCIVLE